MSSTGSAGSRHNLRKRASTLNLEAAMRPKRARGVSEQADNNLEDDPESDSLSSLGGKRTPSPPVAWERTNITAPPTSEASDVLSGSARQGASLTVPIGAVASSSEPRRSSRRKKQTEKVINFSAEVSAEDSAESSPRAINPVDSSSLSIDPQSVFISGDPVTKKYEPLLSLPNHAMAKKMVATYFEMTAASLLFLHRPSVDNWLKELMSGKKPTTNDSECIRRKVILFVIFAEATCYMEGFEGEANVDCG
jgi:hypothetical protein